MIVMQVWPAHGPSRTHLIVLGERGNEDDRVNVIERVNPFSPLVTLATDVEHREIHRLDREIRLHDTRCAHSRSQHVLLGADRACVGRRSTRDQQLAVAQEAQE